MSACEFYGCNRPLAPEQPETGMKLCVEHDAEFTALAVADDYAGLLDFFMRSHGGPMEIARGFADYMAAANLTAAD